MIHLETRRHPHLGDHASGPWHPSKSERDLRYQQTMSSTIYACLADNVVGERRTRAGVTGPKQCQGFIGSWESQAWHYFPLTSKGLEKGFVSRATATYCKSRYM